MPNLLHKRLFDRARKTYDDIEDHVLTVSDPAKPAGQLTVIRRDPIEGAIDRDFALVGATDDGVLVAVRGTIPPEFTEDISKLEAIVADWTNNANTQPTHANGLPGMVHAGFAQAAANLIGGADGVRTLVQAQIATAAVKRIVLTGHSKGGPVAQILAFLLHQTPGLGQYPIDVITFAAARPGDAQFRDVFAQTGIGVVRYETWYDIVPTLPPGTTVDPAIAALLTTIGVSLPSRTLGFEPLGDPATALIKETQAEADAINARQPWANDTGLLKEIYAVFHRLIDAHSTADGLHYAELVKR